MSLQAPFHRIRQLQPQWDPSLRLSRLGAQRNSQAVTWAYQGKGVPGWLILTRNPDPSAFFVNRSGDSTQLRLVFDERCFEDTIFRVEKTPTHLYLADVWMFNGHAIFDETTFQQRQEFIKTVFATFYTPCPEFETLALDLRENVKEIRGKEYYTNERGARGVFIEDKPLENEADLEIMRTEIPDVYRIRSNGEYLQVRTLALSRYLKTLGATFTIRCRNNNDGTWTPVLSSSTLTNEE
jgi:hypothetical protein